MKIGNMAFGGNPKHKSQEHFWQRSMYLMAGYNPVLSVWGELLLANASLSPCVLRGDASIARLLCKYICKAILHFSYFVKNNFSTYAGFKLSTRTSHFTKVILKFFKEAIFYFFQKKSEAKKLRNSYSKTSLDMTKNE